MDDDLQLLNVAGAAKLLGVSAALLNRDRVHPQIGVPYIKLGGSVRYDRAALIAWVRSRTVTPTPQATAAPEQAGKKRLGRPRKL